jgi:hypothetical protein
MGWKEYNWHEEEAVKAVLNRWTQLHAEDENPEKRLPDELSSFCRLGLGEPDSGEGNKGVVYARMGAKYYGSNEALEALLDKFFTADLMNKSEERKKAGASEKRKGRLLADPLVETTTGFGNGKSKKWTSGSMAQVMATGTVGLNPSRRAAPVIGGITTPASNTQKGCEERPKAVLPAAPKSSCDQPHPHKVSSGFPKEEKDKKGGHEKLVAFIYNYLADTCYYADVARYVSFHSLGGAVRKNPDWRAFAYANKPYLLQIQSWWNDSSRLFVNEQRNEDYVAWVNTFRKEMDEYLEGAFINFIDKDLLDGIQGEGAEPQNNPAAVLKLLKIYYGKNLDQLRKIKKKYDPNNVFNFPLSIPPADQ